MPQVVKVNSKKKFEIFYENGKGPKFFAEFSLYTNAFGMAQELEKKVGKGNVYIVDQDGEIKYGA